VLLVAEADLGDPDLAGLVQGLPEQRVGLRAGLLRDEVVGLLVQHGVDLLEIDELLDVDRARGLDRDRLEVVVGQDHVAILLVLVPLHDVLVADLLAVDRAHPLHADPSAVLVVELIEPKGLLLGGGIDADGDRHQPEGDGSLPHGSGHVVLQGSSEPS